MLSVRESPYFAAASPEGPAPITATLRMGALSADIVGFLIRRLFEEAEDKLESLNSPLAP